MSILDRFNLADRRLFITGGSRGLGKEMALAIADAGAHVILVGRDAESLDRTADQIRSLGRQAWPIVGDVGDPSQCESICNDVVANHGPIDILINNVGGRRENIATEQMPLEKWKALIDLNLTSTFLCTKIIGGHMIERGTGGKIINIASINALVATSGIAGRHYETAKAGIVQFTRSVAADWAPHGINVNTICPGTFMTEPNVRWSKLYPDVINDFKSRIPMGRFGEPEEIGPLAVYLAADASSYMTGAAIVIDGGYTLW